MSSRLRWTAAFLLLLTLATHARADVAVPGACIFNWFGRREQPFPPLQKLDEKEYDFKIIRDPEAKQAELRIPRRMLVAEGPAGVSTRHAMTGLAISAAFIGGGLWCLRIRTSKIPKKKVAVVAAVVVLIVAGLTVTNFAEANMPAPQFRLTELIEIADVPVQVRIVEEGSEVQLVVPPELADKISAR